MPDHLQPVAIVLPQVMMAVLLVAQVFMMYLKTFLFFKLKTVVAPVHHARVYKYGGYAIQLGSWAVLACICHHH